jgi:hypothetical protein
MNISYFIIRSVDGSIDHEATLGKFAGDLLQFEAEREIECSTIGAVVHATFDTHLGKRLPTPFVLNEALRALNAQPENYKVLTEKVQQFIRTSPEFHTLPGKGGGVARLRDLTPEQRAKLEE